jgi:hypothetical protein
MENLNDNITKNFDLNTGFIGNETLKNIASTIEAHCADHPLIEQIKQVVEAREARVGEAVWLSDSEWA